MSKTYSVLIKYESGSFDYLYSNFHKKIISIKETPRFCLYLTDTGELYKTGELPPFSSQTTTRKSSDIESYPERIHELTSINIKMVTCSSTIIHILTDEGMFYSWGEDNENTGVLGLGAINSQTFPTTPMAFMDKRLKFIHCGEKHAAAIDNKGRVYLWGTGFYGELGLNESNFTDEPQQLASVEILNASSVVCYRNCTAIITVGGHLYFLGSLRKRGVFTRAPLQIASLSSFFIKTVIFSQKSAFILSRDMELFLINKNFQVQRILSANVFSSISLSENSFLGLTPDAELLTFPLDTFYSNGEISVEITSASEIKQAFSLENTQKNLVLLGNSSKFFHILAFEAGDSRKGELRRAPPQKIQDLKQEIFQVLSTRNETFSGKNETFSAKREIFPEFPSNPLEFSKKTEQASAINLKIPYKMAISCEKNQKILDLRHEIENLFSPETRGIPTKTSQYQYQELVKDLDLAFASQRHSRIKDFASYHRKIENIASELKKIANKPLLRRECLLEIPLKSLQNFSFSQPKPEEKPLDYFLSLINARNSAIHGKISKKDQETRENSPIRSRTPENLGEFVGNAGKKSFLSSRKPANSQRKASFITKKVAFSKDFNENFPENFNGNYAENFKENIKGIFKENSKEKEGFSLKKLGKRMFTFGLDENEGTSRKKAGFSNKSQGHKSLILTKRGSFVEKEGFNAEKTVKVQELFANSTGESLVFAKERHFHEKKLENSAVFSVSTENFMHNMEIFGKKEEVREIFDARKGITLLFSFITRQIYLRKMDFLYCFKEKGLRRSIKAQKIYLSVKLMLNFAKNLFVKELRKGFTPLVRINSENKRKNSINCLFSAISRYISRKNREFQGVSLRLLRNSRRKFASFEKICTIFARKSRENAGFLFETLKIFCSEQIKREHRETLRSLALNKLLFLLFEIFQRHAKNYMQTLRNHTNCLTKHEKKTSLKDIVQTVEGLVRKQRDLGLEARKNTFFLGNFSKVNRVQIECLWKIVEKICGKRVRAAWKLLKKQCCKKTARKTPNKENFPRKLNKKEMQELEKRKKLQAMECNNKYRVIEQKRRGNLQCEDKSLEKDVVNRSHSLEKEINQSFGNISKIQVNNSVDTESSPFNTQKSTPYKRVPIANLNKFKLMQSDFHDPRDPKLLLLQKDEPKEYGLAEPHELEVEKSANSQRKDLFHELELISPKIIAKDAKKLDLSRNYCSLVQYKSISPSKSGFENYLKEFKANDDGNALRNMDINQEIKGKSPMDFKDFKEISNKSLETSKYSTNSNNNYKRVIENQKKFIGNFHKQVYNTIAGRIASPSYQDYAKDKLKY